MNQLEVKFKWFASHFIKVYIMGCKPATVKDLNILHLSDNFLVINKACDIPINSDSEEQHPVTVATQLKYRFHDLYDPTVKFGFRFCHRLDYSTSGALAIALNKKAAKESTIAFNSKKIDKYYLALVHGHVQDNMVEMDQSIGVDSRSDYSHRMCSSDKEYCLKPRWAMSKLLVLQRGLYTGKPATKVLMKLITGRRHQLRVHCHELGHTIIGDYTYSNRKDVFPYRMFLHSYRLYMPTNIETLDILTDDPFTEHEPKNEWCPTETVYELDKEVFSLFKDEYFVVGKMNK
ncbi:RNA pseudouridylate synthase domain-containing protein 1-like [Argiope bruennichi]|uniref:RNA pseudouridylate synthase domain-containing protein 1-like n=1 Tax=Argiope bruennichi TaxID=94029 RepID=UPI002493E0CC|nr:RNA pseudouridylate synthase domain-containing protein 1-like [Argiope bruennichi]XP_055945432.1 RNA pseudouridylate synthase domain-containing protein 1-like [Argiope bruennichi]